VRGKSPLSAVRYGLKRVIAAARRFDGSMRERYRPGRLAAVATFALAISLILQLFVPPYLGMSNDGSFDSVLRETGLSELDENDPDRYFNYYERVYRITGRKDGSSTQPWLLRLFVRAAVSLDTFFTRDDTFDMRWLAALYSVCYLGSAYLLMRNLLSQLKAFSAGLILVILCALIMGDTTLVTRFASLYTQPLEWILFINIVNAIYAISRGRNRALGAFALLSAVILLMSVNRYAALAGIVFSVVYWRLAGSRSTVAERTLYASMAVALIMVSVVQTAALVNHQTDSEKYNQMTRGVLFEANNPEEALEEFGIAPRYSILADTYADQSFPIALMDSRALQEGFLDRYETKEVVIYYLWHPASLMGLLDVGIHSVFSSRPSYSGNYEKTVGLPAMAKSPSPALWSTFKEQLAPKTISALLILLMIIVLLRRRKRSQAEEWLGLCRSLLNVALLFSLVELLTVLVMSGDSELVRESFLMGTGIDVLVMVFVTEVLYKTKTIGREEGSV
jgi:hypothetical protein